MIPLFLLIKWGLECASEGNSHNLQFSSFGLYLFDIFFFLTNACYQVYAVDASDIATQVIYSRFYHPK